MDSVHRLSSSVELWEGARGIDKIRRNRRIDESMEMCGMITMEYERAPDSLSVDPMMLGEEVM